MPATKILSGKDGNKMGTSFKALDRYVRILGRTRFVDGIRYFNYSCSGIEFEFTGTGASVVICTDNSKWEDKYKAYAAVFIDDECEPVQRIALDSDEAVYKLFESDTSRKVKIRLIKMSEAAYVKAGIKEIIIEGGNEIRPADNKDRHIEFIGDSITCGYGIEGVQNIDIFNTAQENPWKAYAAKAARHFNADFNCVSWSGIGITSSWTDKDIPNTNWLMPMLYKYTDAGMDGWLGNTECEIWDNRRFEPHLIVINLGTNDASYTKGIKERIDKFADAYYQFLRQVRSSNPNAEIICTLGAMRCELCPAVEKAAASFKADNDDKKIHTLFFQVQSVNDGIGADGHPGLKTQDRMAKELISKIEEVIGWYTAAH